MTKTSQELEAFAGWDKLESREQQTVRRETEHVEAQLLQEGQSKIAIGESLSKIRGVLQPRGIWIQFLKGRFHMSRATAYRYIETYEEVAKALPKKVLSIAKERGFKIKPGAVALNPPPTTNNEKEIVHYLERMERPTVVNLPKPVNTDEMLKECVNFVASRFQKIPSHGRAKTAFIHNLMGMLMTTFGVSTGSGFSPVAVPAHFRGVIGRPPAKKAA